MDDAEDQSLKTSTAEEPEISPRRAPEKQEMSPPRTARPSGWAVHRRLYDWVLHWAATPYALPALIVIAFLESSFFPIPPDILLIALVAGSPTKWAKFAFWCTVASVVGGVGGYLIGAFFWESVGQWIVQNVVHVDLVAVDGQLDIALPSYLSERFGTQLGGDHLFQVYDHWNAWIAFVFGLTPLPYKLVSITAGVAKVDLDIFLLASIAARGLRFYAVAGVIRVYGESAKKFIDRYFNLLSIFFVALLAGAYVLVVWVLG